MSSASVFADRLPTPTAPVPAIPTDSIPPTNGVYSNEQGSPLLQLIRSSKKTIDIEIYQMENAQVLDALRAALRRGVKIRVIKDPRPLGDGCKLFAAPTDPKPTDANCLSQLALKEEILKAGGEYIPFAKAELCGPATKNCFLHGKLVIADKKTALISTGNFNDTSLCDMQAKPKAPERCNRDFSVITNEKVAIDALNAIVDKDSKSQPYDLAAILTPKVTALLTVSPLSMDPLIAFIDSATTTLDIQNQYLKEPTLNEAILRAAKRGVKVRVTVASLCSFGKPSTRDIDNAKTIYGAFDAAGISTRMFTSKIQVGGNFGYLHSKIIVVNGKKAWVGSVNGSSTAVSANREFGLFTAFARDVGALNRQLKADHESSGAETWEESSRCLKDDPIAGAAGVLPES